MAVGVLLDGSEVGTKVGSLLVGESVGEMLGSLSDFDITRIIAIAKILHFSYEINLIMTSLLFVSFPFVFCCAA